MSISDICVGEEEDIHFAREKETSNYILNLLYNVISSTYF